MINPDQNAHLQDTVDTKPEIMGPRSGGKVVANMNHDMTKPR
jgi:hypothetical protein